jgi:hypothetical protein
MHKFLAVLLVLSCSTLLVSAQSQQEQTPAQQAPEGEQKAADRNHPAEPKAESATPAPPAAAAETTQYPLEQFQNFSAIQHGGPLPGMNVDRHIYRSGKWLRAQSDDLVPAYHITDLIKQKDHLVSAPACLAMDVAYVRAFPFSMIGPRFTYERIPVDEETLDGHQCRVEDVKIHSPKNPVVMYFRLYEAEDLQGFPIKIENRNEHNYRWVITYKDVRLGPQDPSLFMYPDRCDSSEAFKKKTTETTPKAKAAPSPKPQ